MWSSKKGFTLIELLVVISIIALLLSIIIPSLRTAKRLAAGTVCVSNIRSLSQAWDMYSEDNDGLLVGAGAYAGVDPADPRYYDWVGPPQDEDGNVSLETLDDRYRGIQKGKLFPYTNEVKVYHCDGDQRLRMYGQGEYAAFRSYSINSYMNGWETADVKPKAVVTKMSEVKIPSSRIVFVETALPKWNASNWVLPLWDDGKYWGHYMAIWHGGRSTLGFADGHADLHKWKDQSTLDAFEDWELDRPVADYWTTAYAGAGEDIMFMLRSCSPNGKWK